MCLYVCVCVSLCVCVCVCVCVHTRIQFFIFYFAARGYQQQDAHEFMRYLLDHLHRELQYSRNGASHTASPQEGVRLSSADGKCCMYVLKLIIYYPVYAIQVPDVIFTLCSV